MDGPVRDISKITTVFSFKQF